MHSKTAKAALAIAVSAHSAAGAYLGFNYGAFYPDTNAAKTQVNFEAEFRDAQALTGTPGNFNSARLYTNVQYGTTSDITEAVPAAIATNTTLLLGLWCSSGDAQVNNELTALTAAIEKYGDAFTSLVAGISVGSEDLYRISPTGIQNGENPGTGPAELARYIEQTRKAIAGTALESTPIGHVDTWTAWVNGSNQAVIDAVDWVGVDTYPYYQKTVDNPIDAANTLYNKSISDTRAAVSSKPIWITETGWPVDGDTVGQAVPSVDNAERYWKEVGCPLFADGETNVWWYILHNSMFRMSDDNGTALYDLSCDVATSADSGSPTSTRGLGSSASSGLNSNTNLGGGSSTTGSTGGGSGSGSSSLADNKLATGGAATIGGSIVASLAIAVFAFVML